LYQYYMIVVLGTWLARTDAGPSLRMCA
jgi:hypothetical protein